MTKQLGFTYFEETKVESILVKLKHSCGGNMTYLGNVLPINPPLYTHKCDDCDHTENLDKVYPTVEYRPVVE